MAGMWERRVRKVIGWLAGELVLAYTLAAAGTAVAAPVLDVSPWHIYGSNTYRADGYNAFGDRTASPYQFTGIQDYDEFNLNFDRQFSAFNRVTGQVTGLLYNASRYRSTFQGTVPERLNIRQENGDFRIPYRVEGGDFFAFESYRTIQRSLKGAQVELQPDWWGLRHSIVLFSGGGSAAWRSFQLKDDWSNGASWLVEHPVWGRMSVNLVSNHRKQDATNSVLGRKQYAFSLAYEKAGVWRSEWLPWLSQRLTVEGEAGRFIGDHAGVNGAASGQNRQGDGFFVQVSGTSMALPALGYRARFEAYEQDYRPNGASIQPDRRSAEGHLSWRFVNGLTARARVQNFHTGWQTTNPTDTNVFGFNLSGPLGFGYITGLSGSVDAFWQNAESRDLTTNMVTKAVNTNVSKAVSRAVSVRAGVFYNNTRDRTNATTGTSITRQYLAALDWRTEVFGFTGVVSPGLVYRVTATQGSRKNRDVNPTLNVSARRGPHSLTLSWSALDQSRPTNDLGLTTRTAGLNYAYRRHAYTLGMEANWYERVPDNRTTNRTRAWRLGAFVTVNFDKPARRLAAEAVAQTAAPEAATGRFALDIVTIKPSMAESAVRKQVAAAGLGAPTEQAGVLVWFARVMRDIDQLQRLAVEIRDGRVERAALVIEFDDVGNSADVRRVFARVQREVVEQYGRPDGFFDQGDFSVNLGADLAANRFIRVMQWKRDGGLLRFGIPRRTDGRVRMELQFARSFPALQDARWSMEALP